MLQGVPLVPLDYNTVSLQYASVVMNVYPFGATAPCYCERPWAFN